MELTNPNLSDVRTTTDTEGRFSLAGTITDRTRLTVRAAGFSPFERSVANDADYKIVLQPAALTADVTVSITRTETRLNETPASVVVIGRNDLALGAARSIDDSLRQIAGFTLFRRSSSRTANPTTHGANLRGVSGSGASRAAVLYDGFSLNDAFGGWTYWSRVPQVAVDRVEVLRGGASSLYGSSGLSGAVNIVPLRIAEDDAVVRAQISGGSQNTFDGSLFAGLSRDQWAFDVAAEAFKTDGYTPVVESERGTADTRANSRYTNAMFGAERRFGASSNDLSGRLFSRGNIFSEDRENGTLLTHNSTYFRQLAIGGDAESEVIGRFEVRTFLQAQVYDQTFSAVSADRNTETLSRLQRVPSHAAGGRLFWTRAFGSHTTAASFEARDVRGFSDEIGYFGGVQSSISRFGGRERTLAFFVQDLWRISKRVVLSLGGRYDRWQNYDAISESRSLSTNSVVRIDFPDRSETAFSPRAAAIVFANDHLSFYGSYSRSFRAPTLNELYRGFRVGNVVTQPNENLRAEYADTFEAGISLTQLRNRLAVRGNFYSTTVTDPVVSVTLMSTPTLITRQRQNVGETRSRGIEIDAEFAPVTAVKISASYLLVDSRVTEFPANPVLVGNFLPQIARQQFNIQLAYRPTGRWSFGVQSRFSSAQFEDELNSLRLRPYATVDATAALRIRKGVEIFAAAENLFNKRYDIGLTPTLTTAAPTFIRAGLRFDFSRR